MPGRQSDHSGPALHGPARALPAASVVELIRRRSIGRPDAVALEAGHRRVSFRDLWRGSGAAAAALAGLGVGPGDVVALWAERTPSVLEAALAVMRLRAAYLPLEPTHPRARTQATLAASGARVLVHDGSPHVGALAAPGVAAVSIADLAAAGRGVRPDGGSDPPRADDVAYVIFTSGSSGTPKGVMVPHGALVNYCCWCAAAFGRSGAGTPLFHSLGYDLAVTSTWPPLAQGGRVVLVPGPWDRESLFDRPTPYDVAKMTPSHARFFERTMRPDYRGFARVLVFGGEALEPALLASLGDRLDGVRLVNHYGPTETTVGCCAYLFDSRATPALPTVPIGRPIWNTRAYVVDEAGRPAGPGASGELVIAGSGVAQGYLGPASGADGFVDEADVGGEPGPAYRTGDLVERLPGGDLLFLGRRDGQVKVSGHRVDVVELRTLCRQVPGVADIAFAVEPGDVDRLEAFVVPASAAPLDDSALGDAVRRALAGAVPPPAVPYRVRVVPELMLNANGKCDVDATRRLARAVPAGARD